MTRASKTDEEWTIMRYFTEKYAEFPKGRLVKMESPDFLLKVGRHNTIGIELTYLAPRGTNIGTIAELITLFTMALQRKEEKIHLYNKKVLNELWLIIHSDTIEVPQSIQPDKLVKGIHLNPSFDKVFLLDLFEGRLFKLT